MYTYKNVTDKIILIWDNDLKPIKPDQIFISFSKIRIQGIIELNSEIVEQELQKFEDSTPKKRK